MFFDALQLNRGVGRGWGNATQALSSQQHHRCSRSLEVLVVVRIILIFFGTLQLASLQVPEVVVVVGVVLLVLQLSLGCKLEL